jgi:hypothetical protein
MNTKEKDNQFVAHTYGALTLRCKRKGSTLIDEDGKDT